LLWSSAVRTHTRGTTLASPIAHFSSLFFHCPAPHRHLHSFPTRRSSDLTPTPPLAAISAEDDVSPAAPMSWMATMWPDAIKARLDRKSTRLNSSHLGISYAVFCLKKKKKNKIK